MSAPTPPLLTAPELRLTHGEPPYSERYHDHYFSRHGGLAETRHVFLAGNGLPRRWQGCERFVVAETGFGTGLNFLATWQVWQQDADRCRYLHYIAVEKHPLSATQLRAALAPWSELASWTEQLLHQWPVLVPGFHRLVWAEHRVVLTLLLGDAAVLLPSLRAPVDAWYLDGFAPSRNPDLWQPQVLSEVARLLRPGGTVATYTVAGAVRRGLIDVGLSVSKRPGFGGKRDMLTALKPGTAANRLSGQRSALVIGAGLAGTAVSRALAERDWAVTLLERHAAPAKEASGNPAGVAMPRPAATVTADGWLYLQAYQSLLALLARLQPQGWQPCGVLLLATNRLRQQRFPAFINRYGLPPELAQWLEPAQASALAGTALNHPALYFPQTGWLRPAPLCRALVNHARITAHYATEVAALTATPHGWQTLDAAGQVLATADVVILANATAMRRFPQAAALPVIPARGQLSAAPATPLTRSLRCVLYGKGYVIPADSDGQHRFGASLIPGDADATLRGADDIDNLQRLQQLLPEFAAELSAQTQGCFAAVRATTPDRLPLVGAVSPAHPGLYTLSGLGARGIVTAPLAAEVLAAQLNQEPWPVAIAVAQRIDPQRFAQRVDR